MSNLTLSSRVLATDRRLDAEASKSLEALARHRWHWTLDESNARRVSIKEYARQIGRSYALVYGQVTGCANWLAQSASDHAGVIADLGEFIERAKMSAEKQAVVEAVQKASNAASFHTARQKHEDVNSVRVKAEQRAERHGTTVADELPAVAQEHFAAKENKGKNASLAGRSISCAQMEGHLASAEQRLRQALKDAEGILTYTEYERQVLGEAIDAVRSLLNLLDARLTDRIKVDWDAELAALNEGDKR